MWIVDCGDAFWNDDDNDDDDCGLLPGSRVEGVLLTHAHFDHIYGLPSLLERFPDVAIYTNEWGKRALADAKLNMSLYHDSPVSVDCSNVRVVKEGDKVFGYDTLRYDNDNDDDDGRG